MNRLNTTTPTRRHPTPVIKGIWIWSAEYGQSFFNSFLIFKQQWLIVGDALLEDHGLLRRPYDAPSYTDEEKSRQGLRILTELSVKGVLVGHGNPVFKNTEKCLKDAFEIDPRKLAKLG